MARGSFLDRFSPFAERSKALRWPFEADGGEEPPMVRVRVLSADEMEAANLAAKAHFGKGKVDEQSSAFLARERTELVWRAFTDLDGQPLAASADALAKQPPELITPLYAEWSAWQAEKTTRPMRQEELDQLIADLKKNTREVPLGALPSSWLIALAHTLASLLADSTPPSAHG